MASPYTPEFKQQAVRLVEESGLSIREAAEDLGVSTESVRNWVRQARVDAGDADGLTTDEKAELINQTAYTQPGLFAVEVSVAELLASWGIRPDAVVGHSVGEFAAAHIAGVYTLEEAAKLIAVRARLMQALPEGGTMAALFADEVTARKAIAQASLDPATIGIGALNGPQSTVISGTVEAVNAVIAILEGQGVAARQLRVSHAFHSPLMAPAMPDLRKVVKATPGRAPTLTWISNLTGQVMTAAPSPDYWCDHAMEAVQFSEGVTAMAATIMRASAP